VALARGITSRSPVRRAETDLKALLNRTAGFPLNAVIDTGSEVTIGNLALRDKLLRRHSDKFWTVPATGVTGVTGWPAVVSCRTTSRS